MRIVIYILIGSGVLGLLGCASKSTPSFSCPPPTLVWQTDFTKDKPGNCEVHGLAMRKARVPIHYGTPALNSERWQAGQKVRATSFPHALTWLPGGCVSWPDSPTNATIFICAGCQKAEREWQATHQ